MKQSKRVLVSMFYLAIAIFLSTYRVAFAGTPTLSDLSLPQVDSVFETFAADLAFRPVEPASAYGKYC